MRFFDILDCLLLTQRYLIGFRKSVICEDTVTQLPHTHSWGFPSFPFSNYLKSVAHSSFSLSLSLSLSLSSLSPLSLSLSWKNELWLELIWELRSNLKFERTSHAEWQQAFSSLEIRWLVNLSDLCENNLLCRCPRQTDNCPLSHRLRNCLKLLSLSLSLWPLYG